MAKRDWKPFGGKPPPDLADARLQLHHAAQVLASTAMTYGTPKPDDSHTNMGYEDGAFTGRPFGPDDALSVRLHMERGVVELRGPGDDTTHIRLAGRTQQSVYERLGDAIAAATNGALDKSLAKPDYELPDHPFANGAPFTADHESLAELDRWFANADLLLRGIAGNVRQGEEASPVRTWPHHFDTGVIISLDPGEDPESARSIGIGLSPGDDTHPEPYFYTRPYPFDGKGALPEPDAPGFWYTRSWEGMILRAGDLVHENNPEQAARRHLGQTVQIARSLLEASS
ncbi:MAG: hypothetical protein HKN20_01110 [Gemmatimonadetes bacterium]|nr:hypothetical protein [Gemmatimonadota bacterium]